MHIGSATALGILCTLALITAVGICAGKKVKSARDFTTGSNLRAPMIAGSLIGTLVGGSSTIGTAQLAFDYGFSAWWFTLGGGIGLCILALVFAKPLYNSGLTTLPQILTREYGKRIATLSAVLMSVGTFMSIVSQMLSGTALITSMVDVGPSIAMLAVLLLMIAYVVFGGAWGAGMVGIVKTILLYVTTFVCGIVSLQLAGGLPAFEAALPKAQYFNLFARGYWKDGGAGASLIFGVLTTQAYILPVVSGKTLRTSKAGAILGGFLTVLIGVAGIFVGMFMRMEMPDISSASALPIFALTYLPGFLGGVILATLLIALVGTGAGLSLGVSTMLYHDIYKPFIQPNASDKTQLRVSRGIILALLLAAALFSMGKLGSLILSWGFLSMGLRGAVAFAPLCFALFSPGRVRPAFAGAAIIAGPLLVLLGSYILPAEIDPLFLGMAVALLITFIGWVMGPKKD